MPELAIVDRATWDRIRGGSICANASTISEKKITEALIGALHEVQSGPEVQEAFARAFARRVGERTEADKPADLERQLAAAQRRVANATRLLVDAPDDLDLRRQRQMDRAEVRWLEVELAKRGTASPSRSQTGEHPGSWGDLRRLERGLRAWAQGSGQLHVAADPDAQKTNNPSCFEVSGAIPSRSLGNGRLRISGLDVTPLRSTCSVIGCSNPATVGAHVHELTSKRGGDWSHWIVPMCHRCNMSPDDLPVDIRVALISANTQAMGCYLPY